MKFRDFVYERPNYDEINRKMSRLIEELKSETGETVVKIAKELNQINSDVSSMAQLCNIRHSINTNDEFYSKEKKYWDEFGPKYEDIITEYYRAVLELPDQKELRRSFPTPFFLMAKNQLSTFSSEIIELLQNENGLVSEYEKLLATAEVEFDGKVLVLPQLDPYCQSLDRDIRKKATLARSNFFKENKDKIDSIYDDLVSIRTEMAHKLGFNDYVEMGYAIMNRLDYDRKMVEGYRKDILKYVVPVSEKLYKRQAKRLGLEKLFNYDLPLEYTDGNAIPKGTPETILENGLQMYKELSPETGEFMYSMIDRELLDVLSKPGKQSGGYCEFLPKEQTPFIFANFNGTSGDIDVLTHEAGHAFQVYQSRWIEQPECVFPTNESCEIHSMSMEFFTWPWMHLFFKEQTEKYYFSHLAGAVQFLPYGVLVDHFQHEVYENPKMTPAERNETWRRLEKVYCPERDYSEDPFLEEGTYWYRQGHIFFAPFYYIDYTLAQVCAFQYWKRDYLEKDSSAWDDYMKICKVGGTKTFTEIVELGNLKSPFDKETLEEVMSAVDGYFESVDDTKF
ncbi:M3 family oligoendopeptidase [Vagococcus sp. PNs007]|uniref:M3 family oligoendopeptidase n=1 Tax=Vagococcus proximus TaxID=2991417 RepID=A0ABT5X1F5_9ENTE|nr:M3 family oligoendopeptidase [Vagococcus proximus]MDF0479827.1 M3 family oligoendopeptidase [Vagococcus proximus]